MILQIIDLSLTFLISAVLVYTAAHLLRAARATERRSEKQVHDLKRLVTLYTAIMEMEPDNPEAAEADTNEFEACDQLQEILRSRER